MNETFRKIKELCEKVEQKQISETWATYQIKKLLKEGGIE